MTPEEFDAPAEQAVSAFVGAAIGDALGWPQEARANRVASPSIVADSDLPFKRWERASGGRFQWHQEIIEPGEYSDDTQLLLSVARSVLAGDVWWQRFTEMELPGWLAYERGGGAATKAAARSWQKRRKPWSDAEARRYFEAGGNGAAMRILPHAVWTAADRFSVTAAHVVRDAVATHGHPRALLGAVLYARALHFAMQVRGPLEYGGLIATLVDDWTWRSPPTDDAFPPGWLDVYKKATRRPLQDDWRDVADETEKLLDAARYGIRRGAIAVDYDVLSDLGALGPARGSGIVSAVAAVYLASRYASDPHAGVRQAAFAEGADTDTLAAMAGGLLGILCGAEWTHAFTPHLQDASYIEQLARRVARRQVWPEHGTAPAQTLSIEEAARKEPLLLPIESESRPLLLPDGRTARVVEVARLTTRSKSLAAMRWKVLTEDGQSIFVKRLTKVTSRPPDPRGTKPESPAMAVRSRAASAGVRLVSERFDEAVEFYSSVLGLSITKQSSQVVTFEGALALSPADPRQSKGKPSRATTPSSDRVRVFVVVPDLGALWERVRLRRIRITVPIQQGQVRWFQCQDPDGVLVDVFEAERA